ncbi:predicted transcriptional regulatory protein FixK (plasmid) [Sinorhizobium fredii NGR234]|uniref:Predicted transcriptional regulatory protein FixK n=1 Tax=Sinorhizobium fredii (strain NBRC 101917 / NGR234) TaxID=394 RepID=C3KMX8_SINFN|nr:helix-turn-helix domain-containing protein [Sinorhizobium fredii]ACP21551.1 predicted transcriptional regulatory protein FixK [Sinorhizobium fredii NGR234]
MVDAPAVPFPSQRLSRAPAEPPRLRSIAHLRRFRRDQDIYGQEERNDTWYRVISGSARKYLTRADGRRQLVDIYLPGDLFGFTSRVHHRFAVQAVADQTLIACYPRWRVEALAEEDSATAREIIVQSFEALERLQEQMLVIGTVTAQEKVRHFLVYFHDRVSAGKDDSLALPISRYDIADMLGISAETVCRAFTDLRESGVISLQGPRHIKIMRRPSR